MFSVFHDHNYSGVDGYDIMHSRTYNYSIGEKKHDFFRCKCILFVFWSR